MHRTATSSNEELHPINNRRARSGEDAGDESEGSATKKQKLEDSAPADAAAPSPPQQRHDDDDGEDHQDHDSAALSPIHDDRSAASNEQQQQPQQLNQHQLAPVTRKVSTSTDESSSSSSSASSSPTHQPTQQSTSSSLEASSQQSSTSSSQEPQQQRQLSCDESLICGILTKISNSPNRVDVAESGFCFIKRVVKGNTDQDLMAYILEANGIELTTRIMQQHLGAASLQTAGRALLDLLFQAAREQEKLKPVYVQAILTIMKTLPMDTKLQAKCCDALDKAADQHGLYELIGQEGGIALIVRALQTHANQQSLLIKALGALVVLTYSSEANCNRVAQADGIGAVSQTLQRHVSNSKMQSGIDVLVNLSCDSKERALQIIQAAGHEHIVAFLQQHSHDAKVQEDGCWALANLAFFDLEGVRQQLASAGAVTAICQGMKLHPGVVEVQQDACRALHHLSKGGPEICHAIVQAQGLEVLGTAIRVHSSLGNNSNAAASNGSSNTTNLVSRAKEAWNSIMSSISM